MVGEEAGVRQRPSEDVMGHQNSNLMRRMSVKTSSSPMASGVGNLFVRTGHVGVVLAKFGLCTNGLAIPFESG